MAVQRLSAPEGEDDAHQIRFQLQLEEERQLELQEQRQQEQLEQERFKEEIVDGAPARRESAPSLLWRACARWLG